jgi:hypothetical protein
MAAIDSISDIILALFFFEQVDLEKRWKRTKTFS